MTVRLNKFWFIKVMAAAGNMHQFTGKSDFVSPLQKICHKMILNLIFN